MLCFIFLAKGITCPRASRIVTSQGVIATGGEPYGDEALAFTKDLCMQREVRLGVNFILGHQCLHYGYHSFEEQKKLFLGPIRPHLSGYF